MGIDGTLSHGTGTWRSETRVVPMPECWEELRLFWKTAWLAASTAELMRDWGFGGSGCAAEALR